MSSDLAATRQGPLPGAPDRDESSVAPGAGGGGQGGGPPAGLGPLGWARWAWRSLTSMRTALVLLFLLALAAVPGSLFPQRDVAPGEVTDYERAHPTSFPWLDRLGVFDVYSSPWFSSIYLLLFVSLAGCVLPRARAHARAALARPPAAPRHLSRLPASRRFETSLAPEAAAAAAHDALRAARYRVDLAHGDAAGGAGSTVSAEKGHARETGNLVFHLALLLLLFAVALGHLRGFTASVVVPEGRAFANSVLLYDEFSAGSRFDAGELAPFSISLDRLDVRYEERGAARGSPRAFEASVRYRPTPDAEPRPARIAPNAPLAVGGAKVFLLGNGYAPRITVRDGRGQVVLQGPVVLLPQDGEPGMTSVGVAKVPDAAPTPLGLNLTLLPTAVRAPVAGPVSVFPDARNPRLFVTGVWAGDLGVDDGRVQSAYRLDTRGMTQVQADGKPATAELAPGQTFVLPEGLGSVSFDEVTRFANFQVSADPGSRVALGAATLALAGLLASLFVRRRRVWVRAVSDGPAGRTVVEVGGLSRSEHDAVDDELDRLLDRMSARIPTGTPTPMQVEPSVQSDPKEDEWAKRPSRS